MPLRDLIRGKKVLYLTVKNKSYIRSYQYKKIIDEEAACAICLFSEKGNILLRVIDLRSRLVRVDLRDIDVVILGFLPQLLIKEVTSRLQRAGRSDAVVISDFFLSLWDTITLDRQYVSPTGLIGRKLKKMDEAACRASQMVITDTKANADFVVSEFGAGTDKTYAMYLLPDKEVYNTDYLNAKCDSKQPETLSEKGNPFKVLYFGTGLPLQGTDQNQL